MFLAQDERHAVAQWHGPARPRAWEARDASRSGCCVSAGVGLRRTRGGAFGGMDARGSIMAAPLRSAPVLAVLCHVAEHGKDAARAAGAEARRIRAVSRRPWRSERTARRSVTHSKLRASASRTVASAHGTSHVLAVACGAPAQVGRATWRRTPGRDARSERDVALPSPRYRTRRSRTRQLATPPACPARLQPVAILRRVKIAICVKEVPDPTAQKRIDPGTGRLVRARREHDQPVRPPRHRGGRAPEGLGAGTPRSRSC